MMVMLDYTRDYADLVIQEGIIVPPINLKEIQDSYNQYRTNLHEAFGEDFIEKFKEYIYLHKNLDEMSVSDRLFVSTKGFAGVKSIFELKDEIKNAENSRYKNDSLIAVYYFYDPELPFRPLRLDITAQLKNIPKPLSSLKYKGYNVRNYVDIEFFESTPIEYDSKNHNLTELLNEYLTNKDISIADIDSIEPISALQDMEKFHMKFLVFDNDVFFPVYIGIGSNQPYNFADKNGTHGKNRFYRFSMEDDSPFEQTSIIRNQHVDMELTDNDTLFEEITSDGKKYYFHDEIGIITHSKKGFKKTIIEQAILPLSIKNIFKHQKFELIEDQLYKLFPLYENYIQVNFDPLERINSKGHEKSIKFLAKKKLLGAGYQDKINVASDLWLSGYDDNYRLKIISLLLLRGIKNGWLERLVINTSLNSYTAPMNS